MTITAALNTSLYGMQTQTERLSTAAHSIANASVFETGADMWNMLMTVVRD